MGIDVHGLQLLRWASCKSKGFGKVATLGRQGIDVYAEELRKYVSLPADYKSSRYCEGLLAAAFGAECVDSFDYSDYEGCTFVADFNHPLIVPRQYSTVIDFGSTEHIYNVTQALKNISSLCADGGQILHCLPANNWCGHGFWQFSPELFFSLYAQHKGYSETQVFIVNLNDKATWYEVVPPRNGKRVEICSATPLYVLVRTVKRGDFSHENVQQSDYTVLWSKEEGAEVPPVASALLTGLKAVLDKFRIGRVIHRKLTLHRRAWRNGLRRNSFLIKHCFSELI